MRAKSANDLNPVVLRRAIERLDALPMRPTSARQVLAVALDEEPDAPATSLTFSTLPPSAATDPAWAVELSRAGGRPIDPLSSLTRHPWWPVTGPGPVAEALARLWRHSNAVAFAARRLAREANHPDPEAVARAGLLHNLGLWVFAAISTESLVAWYDAPDAPTRLELERTWLGGDAPSLGRDIATRWGCEPMVVDAAWLHADLDAGLNACSGQPDQLAIIQQAYALAATTPWAPGAELVRDLGPIDPRVRILTAEVQARCGPAFVEIDASAREERLTRDNARLRSIQARMITDLNSKDRFLRALVESSPTEAVQTWADRAALAWCGEPGVSATQIVWSGVEDSGAEPAGPRPPSAIYPLGDPDVPIARVQVWGDAGAIEAPGRPGIADLWDAWAAQIAERDRIRRLLDNIISAHRGRVGREETTRRRLMLEALAEFAAGAGHELNNPLAVIVGRAQLLLVREEDSESIRSLRAIIAQAQRAARILRDLIYVARPPEPRPRPCQPEEVVRACLRDLQAEAEARGVRIVADVREPSFRVWTDPEPLRQIADILTRNAMEATPAGGLVQFNATGDGRTVRWTVHDHGRGIGPTEGMHLFDPFYCGRQAGRGLGLGLPRAARIIAQAGGELKWQSSPGHGTTFTVTLPVSEIPTLPDEERPGVPRLDRTLPAR